MAETGVDISAQYSKKIDDVMQIPFDYVVTVCSHAHETCPVFPAKATVLHRGFDDPPSLTAQMADGEAKLNVYRTGAGTKSGPLSKPCRISCLPPRKRFIMTEETAASFQLPQEPTDGQTVPSWTGS